MGEEREAVIRRALTHVHQTISLDGCVLAKSTLKHTTKMGQGPAVGARRPDYSFTRPLSV
jgi:hypothetical protein